MADFKALANKLITKTFSEFQKVLSICTIDGSKETGTAIDVMNNFVIDVAQTDGSSKQEDFDYMLVTNVDQWKKPFDAGNADLVFDGKNLKIIKIERDAANAAYFISAKTYERQTVIIQSVVETADGSGGFTSVWSTFATVEAEIEYKDGAESMQDGRLSVNQVIQMVFRYEANINEKMRVVFGGDNMPIRSVVDTGGRNEWITLLVERAVAS